MYMCSMPWLVCCYVIARLLYLCFLSYIAKYLYETHKKSASDFPFYFCIGVFWKILNLTNVKVTVKHFFLAHQENVSVQCIPPYTPLLYSKTEVCGGIPIFLIFAPKHRLWVLVRTASDGCLFPLKINRVWKSLFSSTLS